MAAKSVKELRAIAKRQGITGFSTMNKAELEKAIAKTRSRQTGNSSTVHDIIRKAMAPGKRKSATGRTYYEYRRNRSDVPGSLLDEYAPIVSAEVLITDNGRGKSYDGEGPFRGFVLVETIRSNGKIEQLELDGEHSEEDMLINYCSPHYWNNIE